MTSTTSTTGMVIIAVVLSALNLLVLSAVALKYIRNRGDGGKASEELQVHANNFHNNTATVHNLTSLPSKYSYPDDLDSISTVSSVPPH